MTEMNCVYDCHSHILPRIDDGSGSSAESIAMLRMEAEQGIRHVIATPHFYPQHDAPERFLARRREAELRLRDIMSRDEGLPEFSVGAEVYYFRGISDSDVLTELTIGQKSCMLLEMPPCPWTDAMYRDIENIWIKHGITPIIAHIDRYIGPWRTFGVPRRLKELPVMVQANASFFVNRSTRKMALRMLKQGQIHLLGSDCHNMLDRLPSLGNAIGVIRRELGEEPLKAVARHQEKVL